MSSSSLPRTPITSSTISMSTNTPTRNASAGHHQPLSPAAIMAARSALVRETAATRRQRAIDNAMVAPPGLRAPSPSNKPPSAFTQRVNSAPSIRDSKHRRTGRPHRSHKKPTANRELTGQDGHLVENPTRARKERNRAAAFTDNTTNSIESNRNVSFDLDAMSNPPSVIILTQNAAAMTRNSLVAGNMVPEENTRIPVGNSFEGNNRISDALLSEVVPESTSPKLVRSRIPKTPPTIDFNGKSDVSTPPSSSPTTRAVISGPSAAVDSNSTPNLKAQDTASDNTEVVTPPSVVLDGSDSRVLDNHNGFQVYPPPSQLHETLRANQSTNDIPPPSDNVPTTLVPFKKRASVQIGNTGAVDLVPRSQTLVLLDAEDTEEAEGQSVVSFDATPPAPPPTPPRPSQSKQNDLDTEEWQVTASVVPFTVSPAAKSVPGLEVPATRLTPNTGESSFGAQSLAADSSPVKFYRIPRVPPNTIDTDPKADVQSESSDGTVTDNVPGTVVAPQPIIVRLTDDESVDHFVNAPDTTSPVTNSSDEHDEPGTEIVEEDDEDENEEEEEEEEEEMQEVADVSDASSPAKVVDEHESESKVDEEVFESPVDMMPVPEEAPRFIPPRERRSNRLREIILEDDENERHMMPEAPEAEPGEWDEVIAERTNHASRRTREYLTRHNHSRHRHEEIKTVEPEPELEVETLSEAESREERRRRRLERRERKARREQKRQQIALYHEQLRAAAEAEAEAEYSDGWQNNETGTRRRERRSRSMSVRSTPDRVSHHESDLNYHRSSRWSGSHAEEYEMRERQENEKQRERMEREKERERRRREYERAYGTTETRERRRRGREPTPHPRDREPTPHIRERETTPHPRERSERSRERSSSRYRDERERKDKDERRSRRRRESDVDEHLVRGSRSRSASTNSAVSGRSRSSRHREQWEAADNVVVDRSRRRTRSTSASRDGGTSDRKRRSQSVSDMSRRSSQTEDERTNKTRRVTGEKDRRRSRTRSRSRRRHRSELTQQMHNQNITLQDGSLLRPIYRHAEYEESESDGASGRYIPWYCEGQSDAEEDAGEVLRCLYISANGRMKCNHARCVHRRRRRRKLLRRGRSVTYHPKFVWSDSDKRAGRRY